MKKFKLMLENGLEIEAFAFSFEEAREYVEAKYHQKAIQIKYLPSKYDDKLLAGYANV